MSNSCAISSKSKFASKTNFFYLLLLFVVDLSLARASSADQTFAFTNALDQNTHESSSTHSTLWPPKSQSTTVNKEKSSLDSDKHDSATTTSETITTLNVPEPARADLQQQTMGAEKETNNPEISSTSLIKVLAEIDDKAVAQKIMNFMRMSRSNSEVITQAFRFVKLDAHIATLLNQLNHLQKSQESVHSESIKQQTKFDIVLDEMRVLAANIAKESLRLTEVEERLESEMEMMNDRIDTAIEKIIQSSVSTQILLDLSKEIIQQTDKSVGISSDVLSELKSVRVELGDVGQASVQTIYNVQKLEDSLLLAVKEAGNKTIYALRQDQQLQYQLLPLASAMRMDGDEASLVPLGNGSVGNSMMQADGSLLPESLPAVASAERPSNIANTPSAVTAAAKNDGRKLKTQQDTTTRRSMTEEDERSNADGSRNTGKFSKLQAAAHVPLLCSSSDQRHISGRPRNCEDIKIIGNTSNGVYRIYPFGLQHNGTEAYCDLESDGGGWTVIQRRKDQLMMQQDFQKTWQDYVAGFGSLHDSHWLGLDVISELTKTGDAQLRIEMTDWEGEARVAHYAYFRVGNSSDLYKLYVTDYSGDAGDSLAYHNGMAFTTKDRDNDLEKNVNCAERYHGAWWYKSCHQSNLNGLYMEGRNGKHESYANGVNWYSWHGYYYSLKRAEMKIRSRHFEVITH